MKRYLAILLAVAVFSCKNDTPSGRKIIIAGKITNCTLDQMSINLQERKRIKLDSTGVFKFECDSFIGTYYPVIQFGPYQYSILFILPGDSIFISFNDTNYKKTVTFTGSNSEINQYLFTYIYKLYIYRDCQVTPVIQKYSPEKYKHFFDSVSSILNTGYNNFLSSNPGVNEIFKKTHAFDLEMMPITDYKRHPVLCDSIDYSTILKKYDLNDTDYSHGLVFTELIWGYLDVSLARLAKKDSFYSKYSIEHPKKKLKIIDELFHEPSLSEKFKFIILRREWMNNFRAEGIDSCYNAYMSSSINEKNKTELKNQYDILIKISKGKTAPNFTCEDKTGKKRSLSQFKGINVVLKFWATWCPPCIESIPVMQKLQQTMKGKNIEFIDVSVDDSASIQIWKKMIKEKKMNNLQLFSGGWESPVATDYLIQSIPFYVLIDKEGIVYKAANNEPAEEDLEMLIK